MSKQEYLEIIKKIGVMEIKYNDERPEYESPELKSMQDEVDRLHLEKIKLNLTPKSEGQETRFFVILDPEYESPEIYEIPIQAFETVRDSLYQVYTSYYSNNFYDTVGINLDNLIALVMNYRGLPIISVVKNADMNNVRYWYSEPYADGLLSMITDDKEQEQTPFGRNR